MITEIVLSFIVGFICACICFAIALKMGITYKEWYLLNDTEKNTLAELKKRIFIREKV